MTLARIQSDYHLNDTLNRFLNSSDYDSSCLCNWTPLVDVVENEDAYEVVAEIPGMSKDDIHLSLEGNVLTLSGEKLTVSKDGTVLHRNERSNGKFERSFKLPKEVKAAEIKAQYENGILTVTLPKAEVVKPKQISIH
ncbi:Hsp20/alpha crystallin family protein [candidate division KSB1 bacterium]|nr:Hsp20/alpha crystallin family protein [candidate division KSB1 bacterium]